jgi:hypothetical protein
LLPAGAILFINSSPFLVNEGVIYTDEPGRSPNPE